MTGGSLLSVDNDSSLWIFGYGSLVWKVNFPYRQKVVGFVKGFVRRFYQGSCDHRGIPGKPGRVATLVEEEQGIVWGVAYEVEPAEIPNVLMYLDIREKDGYKACYTMLNTINHPEPSIKVMLYIATPENTFFLGPAPINDMAKQIITAEGPSGKNSEYLLNLASFMHGLDKHGVCAEDDHLFELEKLVKLNSTQ